MGQRVISPRIISIGTALRRVVRFTYRPLYPQPHPTPIPDANRTGVWMGPRISSDHLGGKKNLCPLQRIELILSGLPTFSQCAHEAVSIFSM